MIHEMYGEVLEIWEPKYSTNSVLIATHKVKRTGTNYITFTKAKHLKGKIFGVDSMVVRGCPIQPNGKGEVFIVPMEELTEMTPTMKTPIKEDLIIQEFNKKYVEFIREDYRQLYDRTKDEFIINYIKTKHRDIYDKMIEEISVGVVSEKY